jgi:thiol-disulfide isomerase/thioredoxin
MVAHRVLAAGSIAVALLMPLPTFAAEWKPFSSATFSAAQKDGRSILVDISAPWCPTCRAQKPILEELTAKPEFKDLIVLKVDFDTQQGDVRALNAQSQSTLIAFKGMKETIRSVGDTNQASIAALLKSAL